VTWFERALNRLFEREEMDGDGRCATYLVRWTLLKLPGKRGIYLHHFVGDDWCLDLHDHPKRFVSIGLLGRYLEETPGAWEDGRWEVSRDDDGAMVRVRWSLPDDQGAHLYVRHYPGGGWGENACEREARSFNDEGRRPSEWRSGHRVSLRRLTTVKRVYRAPWIRTFPANYIHRISLIDRRPCWTLVMVLKNVRPWGFWHGGTWVPWREYVASDTATKMKSCQE
jgi:hypothetical protein